MTVDTIATSRMGTEIPVGWRTVRFDAMADIVNDHVDDPAEAGVEYYVGLEHIDPESLKIRRWGKPTDVEATKLRFKPGDIIFGRRRAYQRKLAVAEFEGICSAHAMVLRAREDVVLPEFLPFFMQSQIFFERAMSISVGSLSPTINWKTLAAQEFALPPRDEQRRMAEMLWAADAHMQALSAVLQQLTHLEQSLSHEAFGSDSAKYKTVACDDICREITVGIVVTPSKYYVQDGVPALRSLNILPDRIVYDDLVHISHDGHRMHSKSRLRAGDVVVVRSGRPGDAAVIPGELDDINCIDLIIARPGDKLHPEYLSHYLNSSEGRKHFHRGSAGTAQQHFNVGALKKVEGPLPSLEEQREIVHMLGEIDIKKQQAKDNIIKAENLKKSLLHELIGS